MQPESDQHFEHIWIITGPAGCGKTTVAQHLATELSLPYIEGDDVRCYHVSNTISWLMQASTIRLPTKKRWPQAPLSPTPTDGIG
jgi:predicted AAA+ superfamily ATPase